MLTGDLNVAVVECIVPYRVNDSYKYLFRVRSRTETFRDMNEAVMRKVVGDRTVTEVLTVGRQEIEVLAKEMLQELCNQYEIGMTNRVPNRVWMISSTGRPEMLSPNRILLKWFAASTETLIR
jgi:membrane protease subunit HflK